MPGSAPLGPSSVAAALTDSQIQLICFWSELGFGWIRSELTQLCRNGRDRLKKNLCFHEVTYAEKAPFSQAKNSLLGGYDPTMRRRIADLGIPARTSMWWRNLRMFLSISSLFRNRIMSLNLLFLMVNMSTELD